GRGLRELPSRRGTPPARRRPREDLAPACDGVAARGTRPGLRCRSPALRHRRSTQARRHALVVQRAIGCSRLLRTARVLESWRRVRDRADRAALRDGDRAVNVDVLRYSAFTDTRAGGNPAGIVLDATGLDASTMQAIAAEVGYSETAFLTAAGDDGRSFDVRYFAPSIEVPFCGHATIATGVALGERLGAGAFLLHAKSGDVPVDVALEAGGRLRATLT